MSNLTKVQMAQVLEVGFGIHYDDLNKVSFESMKNTLADCVATKKKEEQNMNNTTTENTKEEKVMQGKTVNVVEPKKEEKQKEIGSSAPTQREEEAWKKWLQRYLKSQKDLLAKLNACKTQEEFNALFQKEVSGIIKGALKKVDNAKNDPTLKAYAEKLADDSNTMHETLNAAAKKGATVLKMVLDWIINIILQVLMVIFKIACRIIACILRGAIKIGAYIVEDFSNKKEDVTNRTEEGINGAIDDLNEAMEEMGTPIA